MKLKTANRIGAVSATGITVAAFTELGIILHLIFDVMILETIVAVVSVFVLFLCLEICAFNASRVARMKEELKEE